MSDYTIKNLKDVEDSAAGFGLSPNLEARFARDDLQCRTGGIGYERLAPNFRVPFGHRHAEQEEVYVLVGGSARMKIEDEVVELRQWDAVRVGPGTMRNVEAGADGAEIVVFGAPQAPQDVDILHGWWS